MALPPLVSPPGAGRRLRALAVSLPLGAALMAALLVGNLAQTASLAILPAWPRAFRAFNRGLADLWWGWCVAVARRVHGCRVVVSGDELPWAEDAIVVVNHQSMADIPQIMALARAHGRLGDLKWFVKDPLKWVPGVGWGMVFLDCVFVKRDWTRDRARVEATFRRLVRGRVAHWLVTFAEGTRLTPGKLAAAQAFAGARGLPAPRHVLVPRTSGFCASVQGLRGTSRAVVDVTIGYVGGVPTLWQYALGFAPEVHLRVRRWALDALPEGADELGEWLRARFREKDELLDAFYANGAFPG